MQNRSVVCERVLKEYQLTMNIIQKQRKITNYIQLQRERLVNITRYISCLDITGHHLMEGWSRLHWSVNG